MIDRILNTPLGIMKFLKFSYQNHKHKQRSLIGKCPYFVAFKLLRSSCPGVFCKKPVRTIVSRFDTCFPASFAKYLRTPIL